MRHLMLIQQANNNKSIIIQSDRRSVRKVEELIGSYRHNFRPGIHTLMQPNLSYSILNLLWRSMQVFPFQVGHYN